MKLISACLLGVSCAWTGDDRYQDDRALRLRQTETMVPVCPEQLGGLPTPRPRHEIVRGTGDNVLDGRCQVLDSSGRDATVQFLRGAQETLKLARLLGATEFVGKSRSPSCGCGEIYDGSFSEIVVHGDGVTAALLRRNGIRVLSGDAL